MRGHPWLRTSRMRLKDIAHRLGAAALAGLLPLLIAACGDDVSGLADPEGESTGRTSTDDPTPTVSTSTGEPTAVDTSTSDAPTTEGDNATETEQEADTTDTTSASTSGEPVECGDGIAEGDEACDGNDLGAGGCPVFGEVACAVDCTLDVSDCVDRLLVCSTPMVGLSSTSQAMPLLAPITVEADFFVTDVNVTVDITHPWVGDLGAILVSPDATAQSVLFEGPCGLAADIDARFDDEGFAAVCSDAPALSGDIQPLTELDDLVGLSSLGEWSLAVWDGFPEGSDGTLEQWCAEFTLSPDNPVVCGDDLAHHGEPCDGIDLNGADCTTLEMGFSGGNLGCLKDCSDFDTSGCFVLSCGDDVVTAPEQCDGDDLGGVMGCDDIPGFTGDGGVTCSGDCTYDMSACASEVITVCSTPGAPISFAAPPTVDIITVADAQTVADVDVFVDITHSWTGDLDIAVASPEGTSVVLTEDPCVGSLFDDLAATFDDEGDPAPPEGDCSETPPALAGNITAAGSLSDFDGEAANGDWILTVLDDEANDDGTLNEWCVLISAE